MIIGFLALGFCGALFSGVWALMSGFGVLAALGFYMLGGSLTMMASITTALCTRPLWRPAPMAAKA